MSEIRYPIKIASERSGVSAHLIRIWEKRYAALTPDRTETNRRLYSDENVARLRLLCSCTQAGHRIGNIATLPDEALRALAQESHQSARRSAGEMSRPHPAAVANILPPEGVAAFAAIEAMDAEGLREAMDQAAVNYGHQGILTRVVVPLLQHIGRLWCEGAFNAANEHFASATLRTYLLGQVQSYSASRNAPVLITVTPPGQLHELGAVLTAAAANSAGWHVIHLGASLPAAEIAGAAIRTGAKMVALSVVYPNDDPELPAQMRMLRRLLPDHIKIAVGGRAADGYREVWREIQARVSTDLTEFYETLNTVRR